MNRTELFKQVIDKCKLLIAAHGKPSRLLNGKISFSPDYVQYKDELITINKDPNSEELELVKNDNKNPVLCCSPDGKIYRSHGEIKYIQEHILNITIE